MEFHWDPLMYPIFGVVAFIVLWITVDLWCCMSGNKKAYVPYYLEPTDKEKVIAANKLEK